MRKSQVTTAVVDHIKHDLVHQPLQLLMGINLFGMTSSTLGTMSRGAASLSKDSSYLQMRSNQVQIICFPLLTLFCCKNISELIQ
jgi:vacuolar protein sorting-associated protein 13A/C